MSLLFAATKFADIAPLISALFSGGLLTALVLWRKAGAEKDGIVAVASRQAIEVFEAAIEQLRADLHAATKEAGELRRELSGARDQVNSLMSARQDLQAEVTVLRRRIIDLDDLVTKYEARYGQMTRPGPPQ